MNQKEINTFKKGVMKYVDSIAAFKYNEEVRHVSCDDVLTIKGRFLDVAGDVVYLTVNNCQDGVLYRQERLVKYVR